MVHALVAGSPDHRQCPSSVEMCNFNPVSDGAEDVDDHILTSAIRKSIMAIDYSQQRIPKQVLLGPEMLSKSAASETYIWFEALVPSDFGEWNYCFALGVSGKGCRWGCPVHGTSQIGRSYSNEYSKMCPPAAGIVCWLITVPKRGPRSGLGHNPRRRNSSIAHLLVRWQRMQVPRQQQIQLH